MKMTYTTKDGRMTVELEGNTQKALFLELAKFQAVFEGEATCKQNGEIVASDDIQFVVRNAKYTDQETGKEKTAQYFEKRVRSGPMVGYKQEVGVYDNGNDDLFTKYKIPEDIPGMDVIPGFNGWHKMVRVTG